MISTGDATVIANFLYKLDTSVRNDLYNNRIADERDYVSRLGTHFNYPFGILGGILFGHMQFQSKWFAKVNNGGLERAFGCDSMLVFKVGQQIKVGLFEAKWPRVIKDPDYGWDYAQKSTKSSHFTDQISRQSKWTSHAAIWEMFFYEGQVGLSIPPFDKYASTCIRHDYAKNLVDKTPSLKIIWNNEDLKNLIQSEQDTGTGYKNETNLRKIVYDILTCDFGKPIDIGPEDKTFTLHSMEKDKRATCPILSMAGENDVTQLVEGFMKENGLSFFQQINLDILK